MFWAVYGHESSLWSITLIFYTCIWIPFFQMKCALHQILGFFMFCTFFRRPDVPCSDQEIMWLEDLSMVKFKDLNYCRSSSNNNNNNNNDDRVDDRESMCSVCLVDFEREDVVSQLTRCGHVFHSDCIQSWLDRNHFTCPLCRSLFLQPRYPKF